MTGPVGNVGPTDGGPHEDRRVVRLSMCVSVVPSGIRGRGNRISLGDVAIPQKGFAKRYDCESLVPLNATETYGFTL